MDKTIEMLEKIKAEIEAEFNISDDEWWNGFNCGLKIILTKVENHIKEIEENTQCKN